MTGYALLAPEALLLVAAFASLFANVLPGRDRLAGWATAFLAAWACVLVALQPIDAMLFSESLAFDSSARFARMAITALLSIWSLWVAGRGMRDERSREAVALAGFSAVGAMLVALSNDLITLFLALELSTMPAYVLMGYRRRDAGNLEGALKYFLLSVLTSLVMLYGFSFLMGLSGSTNLADVGAGVVNTGTLGLLAGALSLVGLLAKLSAAPFHYWTPDAYEGAAPESVAFVSTAPKIAGTVAIVRMVSVLAPALAPLTTVIAVLSALSMVLGNLAALNQTDIRRLMAYSGVAHTGYVLLAVAVNGLQAFHAAIFYSLAYAVPSLAVMLVAAEEDTTIEGLAGMGVRRAPTAWLVLMCLVSLVGVPPFVGFFGKLGLFTAAVDGGLLWLVLLAVTMSVVSAGYYFRIVRAMFLLPVPEGEPRTVRANAEARFALLACGVLTLGLGLLAGQVLQAL